MPPVVLFEWPPALAPTGCLPQDLDLSVLTSTPAAMLISRDSAGRSERKIAHLARGGGAVPHRLPRQYSSYIRAPCSGGEYRSRHRPSAAQFVTASPPR